MTVTTSLTSSRIDEIPNSSREDTLRGSDKKTLNVLVLGQSVGNLAFDDSSFTDVDAGITAFNNKINERYVANTLNGAKDGIAIRDVNKGSAGAYLDASNAKSATYVEQVDDVLTAASVVNADIDQIVYIGGNTDAAGIDDSDSTKAETKTSVEAFFTILKADFPNAIIGVVPLGANTGSTEFTGYREYGQLEMEVLDADTDLKYLPSYVGGAYKDNTHLSEAGATSYWALCADAVLGYQGARDLAGKIGPRVTSLSFDVGANLIYINFEKDGLNDISQDEAAVLEDGGIVFDVDGTLRNSGFGVLEKSENRIRSRADGHTLSGGEDITLQMLNTTLRNATVADLIKDSAGLSIRKTTSISATA